MSRSKRVTTRTRLDLENLENHRYATIASVTLDAPSHPVFFEGMLSSIRQAKTDLLKVRPYYSRAQVIVFLVGRLTFQLVVPATLQGALFSNTVVNGKDRGQSIDSEQSGDSKVSPNASPSARLPLSLEESALKEAEQIAAASAEISMRSVDVGNLAASKTALQTLSLEETLIEFAQSPCEKVSRNIFVRARGPVQTIRYSKGKKTVGGNCAVASRSFSAETFILKGCSISHSTQAGYLQLTTPAGEPGRTKLSERFPGTLLILNSKDDQIVRFLKYAEVNSLMVDLEVCVSEKVSTRRRTLIPLRLFNKAEILAYAREDLELLEEAL